MKPPVDVIKARLDYEPLVQLERQQNLKLLQGESTFRNPHFIQKVRAFAERWDLEPETVWEHIQDDWLFSLQFAKDPGRQSVHQRLAAKFIQETLAGYIDRFRVLPSGGPKSKWVISGMLFSEEEAKERGASKQEKTVDFEWRVSVGTKSLQFYASHKYTGAEGGSQDNQCQGLVGFIEAALPCTSPDIFYVAIADGPYYQRQGRLDVLNSNLIEGRHRVRACTTNTLARVVASEAHRWLNVHGLKSEALEALAEAARAPEPEPAPSDPLISK